MNLDRVAAALGEISWTDEPWDRRYIKQRRGKEPLDRHVVDPDPSFRRRMRETSWDDYDLIAVSFSGGKDSLAALLHILDMGAPKSRIELWHQNVDGDEDAPAVMDWPMTRDYTESVGSALGVPVLYQWRGEGLYGEMARKGRRMHPVYFESPEHLGSQTPKGIETDRRIRAGEQPSRDFDVTVYRWDTQAGRLEGRRGMPARSPNLQQRWCSDVVKIEPFNKALVYDPRLDHRRLGRLPRVLVITGERRLEGQKGQITIKDPRKKARTMTLGGRAAYALLEPHSVHYPTRRIIDHWRPVMNYSDKDVWDIIRRHKIRPHPIYELGPWGRCSCSGCIYSLPRHLAGWRQAMPKQFAQIASLDDQMAVEGRMTWRKGKVFSSLPALESGLDPAVLRRWKPYLQGRKRITPDYIFTDDWKMPLGAEAGAEGGAANRRERSVTARQAERAARWLRAPWVCRSELRRGMEVEQEHTANLKKAARIAAEHLVEVPDYYTRLDEAML